MLHVYLCVCVCMCDIQNDDPSPPGTTSSDTAQTTAEAVLLRPVAVLVAGGLRPLDLMHSWDVVE